MRRFYSPPETIADGCVVLGVDETRHLRDVLRLHVGDHASVFDGLGREYLCTVEMIAKKETTLAVVREIEPSSPESPLNLTIAAAILPGEKFDITVQKAAELGVYHLQPLYTVRCEVKPGGGPGRLERWRKISAESSKQSGRARLMSIAEPVRLNELFDLLGAPSPDLSRVFFSERDGADFSAIMPADKMIAVFGPKGGWDDPELAMAKDAGFSTITFGGRIMRAETAAIAMTSVLQHRFGDLS